MNKKKIIVFDCFGGLNNSIKKALNPDFFEIYTFDILKNDSNTIFCDFTNPNFLQDFIKMKEQNNIPDPNIIVGSPPCQSFTKSNISKSTLLDHENKKISGNAFRYFCKKDNIIKFWPEDKNIFFNGFLGNNYKNGTFSINKAAGIIGNLCIENFLKLIIQFKPQFFYIENPANSFIWEYISNNLGFRDFFLNIVNYGAYSPELTPKKTGFFSNVKMDLRQKNDSNINQIDKNTFYIVRFRNNKKTEEESAFLLKTQEKLREKHKNPNIQLQAKYLNSKEICEIPKNLILHIFNYFHKSTQNVKEIPDIIIQLTKWNYENINKKKEII